MSTLDISYISYFYHVFPLHINSFNSLFYTHTLPAIERLKLHIYCFSSYFSQIVECQIDSLCQFQSIISEFQSDINCDIQELNSNIDCLLNFNSVVTKCVKSYLCKYITLISSHYNSCYKSLKQNIETFECVKKCVESMESQINGTRGSELYVKRVFRYISGDNFIKSTISMINRNSAIRRIKSINVYFSHVDNFLDESNDISKTTTQLGSLKHDLSQFSGYITNYTMRIPRFLINPLSSLISKENEINKFNNSGNGIKDKYEAIKHKIKYCKESLEFEKGRLESISNNAKMLQEHLELIISMLNNYKSNVQKLEKFRQKINQVKQNKDDTIKYLKCVVKKVMSNFCKIRSISNSLKCRIECVSITTIKHDIENINSDIKNINNILSVVQSHLEYLVQVKLGVDCKILTEIESCILGIVCEIHNKYCCLSSDISQIFSDRPNLSTLGEACKFCEILKCLCSGQTCSSGQTSNQSCERCQGARGSPGCQCCQKTCESLKQLLSKSSGSNIQGKLDSINRIICKLINGQGSRSGTTCPTTQQCSKVCQKGQGETATECKGTNIRELLKCCLDEIKQSQASLVKCEGQEEVKCEQITGKGTTTSCSQSTSSTVSNCNQLDKVKLCIDTMINKCNCCNLKELMNDKNIKSCVDVFKCVMITNFRELFCLYLCFDKSILDQISCNIKKLDEIKLYFSEMLCIQNDIKCSIDCIKNEINGLNTKVESLENTMKSGIREMECAIEGVVLNFIKCSTKQLSTHLINCNSVYHNRIVKNNIKII